MKYEIICLNKKEAEKLYNMLDKIKKVDYIGEGELSLQGRKVTFITRNKSWGY